MSERRGDARMLLQLSHGFSAVDTAAPSPETSWWPPLQLSHGFSAVDTPRARESALRPGPASTEPRLFSRGYVGYLATRSGNHQASTEPRLFSRGYGLKREGWDWQFIASTEPRLFSRGYSICRIRPASTRELQLSHGFSAVDTSPLNSGCRPRGPSLQLSHGFSAVDTSWMTSRPSGSRSKLQLSHGFSAVDTTQQES